MLTLCAREPQAIETLVFAVLDTVIAASGV